MANNTDIVKEIESQSQITLNLNKKACLNKGAQCLVTSTELVSLYGALQRARDALRWIPCEERLPVESRLYWVTVLRPIPVNGKRLHVTQRFFDVLRGAFIIGEDKVLAWLEWPAAYTPEEK